MCVQIETLKSSQIRDVQTARVPQFAQSPWCHSSPRTLRPVVFIWNKSPENLDSWFSFVEMSTFPRPYGGGSFLPWGPADSVSAVLPRSETFKQLAYHRDEGMQQVEEIKSCATEIHKLTKQYLVTSNSEQERDIADQVQERIDVGKMDMEKVGTLRGATSTL